jgi:hypothetical protein
LGEGWGPQHRDEVVWVDVTKLDRCWRESSDYVGPGGTGANIRGRYEDVGEHITAGNPLLMPSVCLDEAGIITFTDGRHRVAWLRDHGVEALPVEVPPDQAATIQARFGTTCRASILYTR